MMLEEAARSDDLGAVVSEGAGIRSVREAVRLEGAAKFAASWIFGVATLGTVVWSSNSRRRASPT